MLSFNTNNGAILALDVLRSTLGSRDDTMARVSSGQRIATAADNAAYWSIATTMRSDNKMLSAVDDALGLAGGIVDSAANGFSAATDTLAEFKKLLIMAREAGVDKGKINVDLDQLKDELKSIADSSSFAAQNWLKRTDVADDIDRQLVGSFRRDADGGVKVTDITYEIAGTAGTSKVNFLIDDLSGDSGILTGSGFSTELGTSKAWVLFNGENGGAHDEIRLDETTTDAEINEMISVVDAMAERTIEVGATLGAIGTRVEMQSEFTKDLQDAIETGVGKMVDADLNAETSRLKALQTQEQLGMQALQIANSSTDRFLDLLL
ncbi:MULTISPECIES: flagellin [Alphaproteobacteria]|uniref:Flagellin n=2 Tax=Alphaproteobacteria TaxID=28211 RepID=A0A512HFK2_9HYPH|nr:MULTISPECIES: flagellin [Alphaproteobacteria]GEO84218.1 flagellin [Ciceribacter naphthalenivorans]GLR24754.1 flagellin [Ciceribacter naphthalenivorans]GLT07610.1 flagellin [Sphingomonas psychrolutea]